MFKSVWNYLRSMARQAVLDGVADALEELESDEQPPQALLPDALRQRLALPAPPVAVVNGGGRRGRNSE